MSEHKTAMSHLFSWLDKTRGNNPVIVNAKQELAALQERVAELESAIAKFTGCNHGVEINSDGESVWCMRCMDIEHAKVLGECRHCGAKLDENLFCTDCNEGFKE